MNTRALAPVVLAGAVALAACGGGGGSASEATIPADADVVVKALEGIRWDKEQYSATAGDVVVVATNASSQPHNLHIVQSDGTELPQVFDIPGRNDVAIDTLKMPIGEYTLICTIPGHANMKSTLTIR